MNCALNTLVIVTPIVIVGGVQMGFNGGGQLSQLVSGEHANPIDDRGHLTALRPQRLPRINLSRHQPYHRSPLVRQSGGVGRPHCGISSF